MAIVDGKTTTPSYAESISPDYETTPLLTVGDEVPYLQGTFGNYTPDPKKKFAMPGIPDGLGVFEYKGDPNTTADDRYYVFMNSEIGATVYKEPNTSENYIFTYFNSTEEEKIRGARVSLFEFDKDWNVLGGRNLIEAATDNFTGITYTLNTATGFYENPNSPNDLTTSLNSTANNILGAMARFCSGSLAESGFVDTVTGKEIPIWFAPEEDSSPTNRGWAVSANGAASSLDGLGRYQKENVVAASQYRPLSDGNTSGKTVLLSTEDFKDGELYMWVGNQTEEDPNGFKDGQLYVLQAINPETGEVYAFETLAEGVLAEAKWTPVPKDIAQGTPGQTADQITAQLSDYVNGIGADGQPRSSNFRRVEDISEDPTKLGTFYFAVTGTPDKTPDRVQDNPLGKIYRLTINPDDPAETGSVENVIVGGYGTGASYDNLTVLTNGNVLIQEDRAYNPEDLGGGDIYKDENRQAYVWEYNPVTDELQGIAELQEDAYPDLGNDPDKLGEWESSGIVQVGKTDKILFDVQAHTDLSQESLYSEGGQLLLARYKPAAEPTSTVRVATYNASLNRGSEGKIAEDMASGNDPQIQKVAEVIQRNRAAIQFVNEFDYFAPDPYKVVEDFQKNYLNVSQNGAAPINYPYAYLAPVNTGIASGFDLNNDGKVETTPGSRGYGEDAYGFGDFAGQYGMLVLSQYPINDPSVRTFQKFLWSSMPDSLLPTIQLPDGQESWYSQEEQENLRLASKSFWDVPINVDGQVIHVLAGHPTPPTFDGPEDRNGKRNHDEIRFWADYVVPGEGYYIYDDNGKFGGLKPGAQFVIVGDQNADPYDGDSYERAILQLLDNPEVNTNLVPSSLGGAEASKAQGGINQKHGGDPFFDTADFGDLNPGNLRIDYVLPSLGLQAADSRIYWPIERSPQYDLNSASDHHLVWVDLYKNTPADREVATLSFEGQTTLPTGYIPPGPAGKVNGKPVPVGGLSGVTYNPDQNLYYAISDDRSEKGPARFYTFATYPETISETGVTFISNTTLKKRGANGDVTEYAKFSLDPEDIAFFKQNNSVFITSEGEVRPDLNDLADGINRVTNPFINEYSLVTGKLLEPVGSLKIPDIFLPKFEDTNGSGTVDEGDTQVAGVRNNLAFESLTITPDQKLLYTGTENALVQDGPEATVNNGSPSRILQYNLLNRQPEKQYLYITDPVAEAPIPSDAFSTNGLVSLLALDDRGDLLALERSFSTGVPGTGNTIKLYQISVADATDISFFPSLKELTPERQQELGIQINPVEKQLLLNFDQLNLPTGLDNVEGMTFGSDLPGGERSIVFVADNNFSATQFTQFLVLGADIVSTGGTNYAATNVTGTDAGEVLVGGDGNSTFDGGVGTDTYVGGAGSDVFVIKPGSGTKTIADFQDGIDLIGLKGGLTFNGLSVAQGTGNQSADTLITQTATNDVLAVLKNVSASLITGADLISVA